MKLSDLNNQNFPTTPQIDINLADLFADLQIMESTFGSPFTIDSGLRSVQHQIDLYSAINFKRTGQGLKPIPIPLGSKHLSGQAADIADVSGELWRWCQSNMDLLVVRSIYLEDRKYTPTWVHMQNIAPDSGKRIFIPY